MKFPIRIDLVDQAGTRYPFASVAEDQDAFYAAEEAAKREAAKFRGTWQSYYEDDPERSIVPWEFETVVFTYGILNDPELQRRAGLGAGNGLVPLGRARALDHRVENLQPANLVEDPEADAPGFLWIAYPIDLRIMDRIEGVHLQPGFYRRAEVKARVEGTEKVYDALCYKMNDEAADRLRRWNLEPHYTFAQGD